MRKFDRIYAIICGAAGAGLVGGGLGWGWASTLGLCLIVVSAIGGVFDATKDRSE